jgi:hypothetical protein
LVKPPDEYICLEAYSFIGYWIWKFSFGDASLFLLKCWLLYELIGFLYISSGQLVLKGLTQLGISFSSSHFVFFNVFLGAVVGAFLPPTLAWNALNTGRNTFQMAWIEKTWHKLQSSVSREVHQRLLDEYAEVKDSYLCVKAERDKYDGDSKQWKIQIDGLMNRLLNSEQECNRLSRVFQEQKTRLNIGQNIIHAQKKELSELSRKLSAKRQYVEKRNLERRCASCAQTQDEIARRIREVQELQNQLDQIIKTAKDNKNHKGQISTEAEPLEAETEVIKTAHETTVSQLRSCLAALGVENVTEALERIAVAEELYRAARLEIEEREKDIRKL